MFDDDTDEIEDERNDEIIMDTYRFLYRRND